MGKMADQITRRARLVWIVTDDLRIDTRVQKENLRVSWVDSHEPNFDPEQLGYIVVSLRDEEGGPKYLDGLVPYVIDGWHRTELLKRVGWGDQQIECEAYEGLTLQEEGQLFLARDDRQAVTAYDKFRVRVTTGDPDAIEINKIVQGKGLRLGTHVADRTVQGIVSIEKLYHGAGVRKGKQPAALGWSLKILSDAWGTSGENFRGKIVLALGTALLRWPDMDTHRMIDRLMVFPGGAAGLEAKATHRRQAIGGTLGLNLVETFRDIYLKRKGQR